MVKINREVFERVGIPQPNVNELLKLSQNDRETWRMYAEGLTMGLNQTEQSNTREKVIQYKPQNITELSAFVAAVRPAFKSMLPVFLARQQFDYGIPVFDKLIQTREMRSSFILYQEQVMKTLQHAGFTAPESYGAIKAISKKKAEKVLRLKERFLEGFSSVTGDAATAEKVWQIIEDATSYLFNASHAVCVALDSLYGAYAKAHYPLEYYTTLLSNYAEKGDKDRIARTKDEMKKGFGIQVAACKFRQDNRDFYVDHEANTISDALTSIKHISRRVADALYDMRDRLYICFTDLLCDMELHPAFDSQVIEILIRLGYFREFGMSGKLQKLYREFREGEFKFSKAHILSTRQNRLSILRRMETEMVDDEISPYEQLRFEIECCGTPISTYEALKSEYAVLEVDDRYSPKVRLYGISNGHTGTMKLKKALFKEQPLEQGSMIRLTSWERKPSYRFIDGKAKANPGMLDLWIIKYEKIVG